MVQVYIVRVELNSGGRGIIFIENPEELLDAVINGLKMGKGRVIVELADAEILKAKAEEIKKDSQVKRDS